MKQHEHTKLKRILRILKANNVQRYRNGDLEIELFENQLDAAATTEPAEVTRASEQFKELDLSNPDDVAMLMASNHA